MMKYFGELANDLGLERSETPVGEACGWCEEAIAPGDSGLMIVHLGAEGPDNHRPLHRNCYLRWIAGSVAHQRRVCSCYGGTGVTYEDDPQLTKRQAADVAAAEFYSTHMISKVL